MHKPFYHSHTIYHENNKANVKPVRFFDNEKTTEIGKHLVWKLLHTKNILYDSFQFLENEINSHQN